jgi:hypothetical protein
MGCATFIVLEDAPDKILSQVGQASACLVLTFAVLKELKETG